MRLHYNVNGMTHIDSMKWNPFRWIMDKQKFLVNFVRCNYRCGTAEIPDGVDSGTGEIETQLIAIWFRCKVSRSRWNVVELSPFVYNLVIRRHPQVFGPLPRNTCVSSRIIEFHSGKLRLILCKWFLVIVFLHLISTHIFILQITQREIGITNFAK